jgi:hypothetical protein
MQKTHLARKFDECIVCPNNQEFITRVPVVAPFLTLHIRVTDRNIPHLVNHYPRQWCRYFAFLQLLIIGKLFS